MTSLLPLSRAGGQKCSPPKTPIIDHMTNNKLDCGVIAPRKITGEDKKTLMDQTVYDYWDRLDLYKSPSAWSLDKISMIFFIIRTVHTFFLYIFKRIYSLFPSFFSARVPWQKKGLFSDQKKCKCNKVSNHNPHALIWLNNLLFSRRNVSVTGLVTITLLRSPDIISIVL